MMKKTASLAAALIVLSASAGQAKKISKTQSGTKARAILEARSIVRDFAGDLKANLMAAMKDGGPVNALAVCKSVAAPLATQNSEMSGWKVSRTALKLRNSANRPDAWEEKVLRDFVTRKAAGEDPRKMEFAQILRINGQKTFRYMKAIPTQPVCLKCHGAKLSEPVRKKLHELYPQDRAIGFSAGDIRGAFSLSKTFRGPWKSKQAFRTYLQPATKATKRVTQSF